MTTEESETTASSLNNPEVNQLALKFSTSAAIDNSWESSDAHGVSIKLLK